MVAMVVLVPNNHNVISNTHYWCQLAKYLIQFSLEHITCYVHSEWHSGESEASKLSVESS